MNLPKKYYKELTKIKENDSEDYDDIKSKVSILPLNSGGASFKTNVLVQKSSSKLYYKPSIGSVFFCFIFLAVGLGVLFFGVFPFEGIQYSFSGANWFMIAFGLIFAFAGGTMFYLFYKPRVFDKQLGFYYKVYKPEIHNRNKSTSKSHIPLKSIVAIQLIGEHVKSDNGSYKSFELNLILEDSTRKNVVDHGNLKSIIDEAHIISEFLDIPIWHSKSNED